MIFRLAFLLSNALLFSMQTASMGQGVPHLLNSTGMTDGASFDDQMNLACDGAGLWIAVWRTKHVPGATVDGDTNVVMARSLDNGASWSSPQALVTPTRIGRTQAESEPDVATDRLGNWQVVWESSEIGGGGSNLFVARSTDNGATWSDGVEMRGNGDANYEENPRVVAGGGGEWLLIFGDFYFITGATQVKVLRSTNNGESWGGFATINTSYKTAVKAPVAATDEAGNWVGLWPSEYWYPYNGMPYGMLASRSSDGGESWSNAAAIAGTSGDKAYSPAIATDREGIWVAVWESPGTPLGTGTDREIVVSRSVNDGANWTEAVPLNGTAAVDGTASDLNPTVATDGKGSWVVLWSSTYDLSGTGDTDADIHELHSLDNGLTWSAPAEFSADPAGNAATDSAPRLAADGQGNWVAGWHVVNGPANTFGTDKDLLVTSFVLGADAPEAEGEGEEDGIHSADGNGDRRIDLTELLRVVQLYNAGEYSCAADSFESEDGYQPGFGNHACGYHDSDFVPRDWLIGLSELLRSIQLFNLASIATCVEAEDGFCAAPVVSL